MSNKNKPLPFGTKKDNERYLVQLINRTKGAECLKAVKKLNQLKTK